MIDHTKKKSTSQFITNEEENTHSSYCLAEKCITRLKPKKDHNRNETI